MSDASARSFPNWLKDVHLEGIAGGRLQKRTLAWMLGVDPEALEVDEPQTATMSAQRALRGGSKRPVEVEQSLPRRTIPRPGHGWGIVGTFRPIRWKITQSWRGDSNP